MIGSRSLPVSNDGYADVVFRHRPLGVQSGRVMRRSGDTIAPDRPLVAAARLGLPTLALLSGGGRGPGARANGWLGCPFRCRLVTVEDAVECLADTRIELAACCSSDLFERCLLGHRLAVGAGGGHGAIGVAASDDAGGERDLPATQSVWVAAAVPALVCGAYDRRRAPVVAAVRVCSYLGVLARRGKPSLDQGAEADEYRLAPQRMRLHHRPLLGSERPGCSKDRERELPFTELVDSRGEGELAAEAPALAEFGRDGGGEFQHAAPMLGDRGHPPEAAIGEFAASLVGNGTRPADPLVRCDGLPPAVVETAELGQQQPEREQDRQTERPERDRRPGEREASRGQERVHELSREDRTGRVAAVIAGQRLAEHGRGRARGDLRGEGQRIYPGQVEPRRARSQSRALPPNSPATLAASLDSAPPRHETLARWRQAAEQR